MYMLKASMCSKLFITKLLLVSTSTYNQNIDDRLTTTYKNFSYKIFFLPENVNFNEILVL